VQKAWKIGTAAAPESGLRWYTADWQKRSINGLRREKGVGPSAYRVGPPFLYPCDGALLSGNDGINQPCPQSRWDRQSEGQGWWR
jgi:hypothetical protein